MPIYTDPSECRQKSRLPSSVIEESISLPGLEALTGADLLVTPYDAPLSTQLQRVDASDIQQVCDLLSKQHGFSLKEPSLVEISVKADVSLPSVLIGMRFRIACQDGLLVQRKTGQDLINFVQHYSEVLLRMSAWTLRPWLLFVGQLERTRKGKAVIDGRATKWDYSSIIGALDAWQLGLEGVGCGYVTFLNDDACVAPWLQLQLEKLENSDVKMVSRKPLRSAHVISDDESRKVALLSCLPGIGEKKALSLLDHCGDDLFRALQTVLDLRTPVSDQRPKGIGMSDVRKCRRLFGLGKKGESE